MSFCNLSITKKVHDELGQNIIDLSIIKMAVKNILVTGGNSGIGFALCKLLVRDHNCHVYLGSRSLQKGKMAVDTIKKEVADKVDRIELIQIDVCDKSSCLKASEFLASQGVKLYALVNNAGVGQGDPNLIMDTNFYGPKMVTEALVDFIDPANGRIVNVSSGVASMWLQLQNDATKKLFSNSNVTFEELDRAVKANIDAQNFPIVGNGYGLSKAALNCLTLIQAREHPNLLVTSLSPGFIDTPMTKGYGAKLTPEQGCVSSIKCLFGDVKSGCYYGSDGLRGPLTMYREPGMPEYEG